MDFVTILSIVYGVIFLLMNLVGSGILDYLKRTGKIVDKNDWHFMVFLCAIVWPLLVTALPLVFLLKGILWLLYLPVQKTVDWLVEREEVERPCY